MQAMLMSKQVNHVNSGPEILHGNCMVFLLESIMMYNSFVNSMTAVLKAAKKGQETSKFKKFAI